MLKCVNTVKFCCMWEGSNGIDVRTKMLCCGRLKSNWLSVYLNEKLLPTDVRKNGGTMLHYACFFERA